MALTTSPMRKESTHSYLLYTLLMKSIKIWNLPKPIKKVNPKFKILFTGEGIFNNKTVTLRAWKTAIAKKNSKWQTTLFLLFSSCHNDQFRCITQGLFLILIFERLGWVKWKTKTLW